MSCSGIGQKTEVPDKIKILPDGQLKSLGITKNV